MAATERVTILMEPAQKAALTKHARAAGQSVGEYIRTRALEEDAVLAAVAAELRQSTAETLRTVDAALARMDAREQAMAAMEAAIVKRPAFHYSEAETQALLQLLAPKKVHAQDTAA